MKIQFSVFFFQPFLSHFTPPTKTMNFIIQESSQALRLTAKTMMMLEEDRKIRKIFPLRRMEKKAFLCSNYL
jgi:hypothetical protein